MTIKVSVPYDTGDGLTCLMSIGEDQAAATSQTAGESTHPFHLVVSNSPRAFGIVPRGLNLSRTVGSAGDTATKSSFIPIGTEAALDGYDVGSTIAVGSLQWTVSGKRSQNYN